MGQISIFSNLNKLILGILTTSFIICCSNNTYADPIEDAKCDPNSFTLPYMSDVAITEQTANSITLEWKAVEGVTKYRVSATTDLQAVYIPTVGSTTTTKFTYSDLKPGTCYQFLVSGINDENPKDIKRCRTAKGARAFTLVSNVENFKVLEATDTSITTIWSATDGAKNYKLYIKENNEWKEVGESTSTKYTFDSLKPNTKYEFAVKGCLKDKLYKDDITILSKDFSSLSHETKNNISNTEDNESTSKEDTSDSKKNKPSSTNSKQKKNSQMDNTPSTGDTSYLNLLFVIGTIGFILSGITLIIKRRNI